MAIYELFIVRTFPCGQSAKPLKLPNAFPPRKVKFVNGILDRIRQDVLRPAARRSNVPAGAMIGDLHLHSHHSDGLLEPSEVVESLIHRVEGSFTDHDSREGWQEM